MTADYHIHTYLCKHAKGMPEEYIKTAIAKGIGEICFTDHAPAPCGYDLKHRMTIDQFPEYKELVAEAREMNSDINILYGIEADYYPGCEAFLKNWLGDNSFDMVLGSVHYINTWGFDDPDQADKWETSSVDSAWSDYFALLSQLADTGLYDVVSHLDLPKKFGHRLDESMLEKLATPALERIANANMAIELNTSGLRMPAGEIYPSLTILKLARSHDIPISFGSDSHSPEYIGFEFDKAIILARDAGYTQRAHFDKREMTLVPIV